MGKPNLVKRFFRSEWSSCIVGPIYGLFFWWYTTDLVLKGAPFTDDSRTVTTKCLLSNDDETSGTSCSDDEPLTYKPLMTTETR